MYVYLCRRRKGFGGGAKFVPWTIFWSDQFNWIQFNSGLVVVNEERADQTRRPSSTTNPWADKENSTMQRHSGGTASASRTKRRRRRSSTMAFAKWRWHRLAVERHLSSVVVLCCWKQKSLLFALLPPRLWTGMVPIYCCENYCCCCCLRGGVGQSRRERHLRGAGACHPVARGMRGEAVEASRRSMVSRPGRIRVAEQTPLCVVPCWYCIDIVSILMLVLAVLFVLRVFMKCNFCCSFPELTVGKKQLRYYSEYYYCEHWNSRGWYIFMMLWKRILFFVCQMAMSQQACAIFLNAATQSAIFLNAATSAFVGSRTRNTELWWYLIVSY